MREWIYLHKVQQTATPQQGIIKPAIGKDFNNRFSVTKSSLKPTPVTVAFTSLLHHRSQLNKLAKNPYLLHSISPVIADHWDLLIIYHPCKGISPLFEFFTPKGNSSPNYISKKMDRTTIPQTWNIKHKSYGHFYDILWNKISNRKSWD